MGRCVRDPPGRAVPWPPLPRRVDDRGTAAQPHRLGDRLELPAAEDLQRGSVLRVVFQRQDRAGRFGELLPELAGELLPFGSRSAGCSTLSFRSPVKVSVLPSTCRWPCRLSHLVVGGLAVASASRRPAPGRDSAPRPPCGAHLVAARKCSVNLGPGSVMRCPQGKGARLQAAGQVGRGFLDRLRAGVDYVAFQRAEADECPVQTRDRLGVGELAACPETVFQFPKPADRSRRGQPRTSREEDPVDDRPVIGSPATALLRAGRQEHPQALRFLIGQVMAIQATRHRTGLHGPAFEDPRDTP